MNNQKVLIIDFGSQLTHLIARQIRDLCFYCEIVTYTSFSMQYVDQSCACIVLSGGSESLSDSFSFDCGVLRKCSVPILGICFGMQIFLSYLGGKVRHSFQSEYGKTEIFFDQKFRENPLLRGIDTSKSHYVWSNHRDVVLLENVPGVDVLSWSAKCPAVVFCSSLQFYGIQFHVEVSQTLIGKQILKNFFSEIVKMEPMWKSAVVVQDIIGDIKKLVGTGSIACAFSGGVDSTVLLYLLVQAIGKERVKGLFVDTGFLRSGEIEHVKNILAQLGCSECLYICNSQDVFLQSLLGKKDPEEKRKIIGSVFVDVFSQVIRSLDGNWFFAQGTIYSDCIESVAIDNSLAIKSHHNVGGFVSSPDLQLIEPLKRLFKDEVRAIASELSLPLSIIEQHPFPGPGLAIRCIGCVTKDKIEILRQVDKIFIDFLKEKQIYHKIWQASAILLPCRSVGVVGDERVYRYVVALKGVCSVDGMTASPFFFDPEIIDTLSSRITSSVLDVGRVLWDFTSKPPATIEWE